MSTVPARPEIPGDDISNNLIREINKQKSPVTFIGQGLPYGNKLQGHTTTAAVEEITLIDSNFTTNETNVIIAGSVNNTIAGIKRGVLQGSRWENIANADPRLASVNDTVNEYSSSRAFTGDNATIALRKYLIRNGRDNDADVAIMAATPPSANPSMNEDANGNCLGAMTRGSSGSFRNVFTIALTDISDNNYGNSIGVFGYAPCDCYVPLNIPLLSLIGKLGRASGVYKLMQEGKTFEAVLRFIGHWDNYLASVRRSLDLLYPIKQLRKTRAQYLVNFDNGKRIYDRYKPLYDAAKRKYQSLKTGIANAQKRLVAMKDNIDNVLKPPLPGWNAALNNYNQQLAALDAQIAVGQTSPNLGNLIRQYGQIEKLRDDLQIAINRRVAELDREVSQFNSIKKVRDGWIKQRDSALREMDSHDRQVVHGYTQQLIWKTRIDNLDPQIAAAQAAYDADWARSLVGDALNTLQGTLGTGFDLIAALDASRPKACFGSNTILNKDTCACECKDGYENCQNSQGAGKAPEWSIVDIISPVQTDELYDCYEPCACNMTRGNVSGVASTTGECKCDGCESGYTWYAGKNCPCTKASVKYSPVRRDLVATYERGVCIDQDSITSLSVGGKIWSGSCGFVCPAGSDVYEGRKLGKYARIEDNLGNPAPSIFHHLYGTGCNYVCDGREANSSNMISPWPPACPAGYVWDGSATVCNCIPCPVKLYYCTEAGSANSSDDCPDGYEFFPGESPGCGKTVYIAASVDGSGQPTNHVHSDEACISQLGMGFMSGWIAGEECATSSCFDENGPTTGCV